jgi:hypothetical protein
LDEPPRPETQAAARSDFVLYCGFSTLDDDVDAMGSTNSSVEKEKFSSSHWGTK